jgi:hypothetical protein
LAFKELDRTRHFIVGFEDSAGGPAEARAKALLETCEQDFTRLSQLMGVDPAPWPLSNRITLRAGPLQVKEPKEGIKAWGLNNGFHTGGGSRIDLGLLPGLPDDVVRAVFIAELTEVFNDQVHEAGPQGWPENTSFSEGISLAMTCELYPDAYYSYMSSGIRVNAWLRSAREDKVAAGATSELKNLENGCALLFLNYLRYQRNHSWAKIVDNGGANLAETAAKLGDGFAKFAELIGRHLASGTGVETENPFPLDDWPQRYIHLDFEQIPNGPAVAKAQGIVRVRPFVTCPVKDYSYSVVSQRMRLRCVATYHGFAAPKAKWTVNGHAIPQVGAGPPFKVGATIAKEEPSDPGHYRYGEETVELYIAGEPKRIPGRDAVRSEFLFGCNGEPGRVLLDVRMQGYEAVDPTTLTEASGVGAMDTLKLIFEPAFYRDRAECERSFKKFGEDHLPWKNIPIWKTLPDPPPIWVEAFAWLELVRAELVRVAVTKPLVAIEMAGALATVLGLQPSSLLAAAGDSSRLEEELSE